MSIDASTGILKKRLTSLVKRVDNSTFDEQGFNSRQSVLRFIDKIDQLVTHMEQKAAHFPAPLKQAQRGIGEGQRVPA